MRMALEDADLDAIADRVAEKLAERLAGLVAAPKADPPDRLLREREAAQALGISACTLKRWRLRGCIAAATSKRPILYGQKEIGAADKWLRTRQ